MSLEPFAWSFDTAGYRWVERPSRAGTLLSARPADWEIEPRGGTARLYEPLEDEPGLFRRFAALDGSREKFLGFVAEFGLLDDRPALFSIYRARLRRMRALVEALDRTPGGARNALPLVEAMLPRRFALSLDLAGRRILPLPATLFDAMALQAAFQAVARTTFRRCDWCPRWFEVGTGAATARRRFCSDGCRVYWNRAQARQAAAGGV